MKKTLLITVALLAALVLSMPAFAAPTSLISLPTADVLKLGQIGLQASLYGPESTPREGRIEAGLPAGLMLGVTVPLTGSNLSVTGIDLRFRPIKGTLVTPAVAVGATWDKSDGTSPYVVLTKGILNAELTAGAKMSGTDLSSASLFGGVDVGLLGPLHLIGEYDDGHLSYGAEFRALNARITATVQDDGDVSILGRVVLPF